MTSVVRSARPEDAEAIAELHVATWRMAYRGHMPDEFLDSLSSARQKERWTHTLADPTPARVLVAEVNHRVAGCCVFGPSRDADATSPEIWEIISLNIHPEHWRCGLGTLLCVQALREMSAEDSLRATLWVIEANQRAQRFYEKLGFLPDGLSRAESRLVGVPLHEVRYTKAINAL